jgi:ribose transport system substrate-binding protein
MKPNQSAALGLVYVALLAQTGCHQNSTGAPETKKPRLVFVTSGTNSFWQSASAGIEAAARDFNAEFDIVSSSSSILDQWEPDGIAFAPINGAVQLVATGGRACFVGIDHYKSGREAGAIVREWLPHGGKILIISQTPDFMTSQDRRRGLADELAEPMFKLIDVKGRQGILSHLDAAMLICLSSRDVADCMDVLCARDKLGELPVIALEDDERTREALGRGHVSALLMSEPYDYGYQALCVLAGLARGNLSVLPQSGFLDLPLVVLRSETASHIGMPAVHSAYDSTLFPRPNAGDLDRATQAGNLVADRIAGERGAVP